ncbi:hypothetical protein GVN24_31275 [Rhizobium sp. CRIBSB]|nr:hypothetical protein [Rhizobium sp. CRIBSB]
MKPIRTTGTALTALCLMTLAGVASAQTTIRPGQTVNGDLTSRDSVLSDRSYFDCYRLQTSAGRSYTVTMRSTAFDTYLALVSGSDCAGGTVDTNDDGPNMGTDSSLTFSGDGQTYLFRANSLSANQTGRYTFSVAETAVSAPTRPVGKPPAGGGSSGSSASSGLRPTDPEERYTWDVICAAVDTVALILVSEDMSDDDLMAWLEDSARLQAAASASARAVGKSEEQMTDDIGSYGAAYFQDETLFDEAPPQDLRAGCLGAL